MYDTAFQFAVLRGSGISSVAMLDKLDVGVGPRAGTGGVYVPKILSALGVSARMGYGSFNEMARDLLTGRYNAVVMAAGAPFAAAMEIEKKEPLNFISLSDSEIDVVRKAMPELRLVSQPSPLEHMHHSARTIRQLASTTSRLAAPIFPRTSSTTWSRPFTTISLAWSVLLIRPRRRSRRMSSRIRFCHSTPVRSATITTSASAFRSRWFPQIDGSV
jgi:hypothetical protein